MGHPLVYDIIVMAKVDDLILLLYLQQLMMKTVSSTCVDENQVQRVRVIVSGDVITNLRLKKVMKP